MYTPADGSAPTALNVFDFKAPGVAMSMYNTDEVCLSLPIVNLKLMIFQSITGFAHSSFKMALAKKMNLVSWSCISSCITKLT